MTWTSELKPKTRVFNGVLYEPFLDKPSHKQAAESAELWKTHRNLCGKKFIIRKLNKYTHRVYIEVKK